MFSTLFTLSLLSLPFVALADPHAQPLHRHRDVAHRARGDVQLHKRFDNARWSFYDVGLGACGQTSSPGDFMVALNTPQFGGGYPGPNCFKSITMTYNGKTTTATILDECPGCPYGGLDLSRGLFDFFAPESAGIIYGTWTFNDGSGGGGGSQPTSSSSQWVAPTSTKPTSTWSPPPTPTSTWSPPPTPTTTSTKAASTTSSSSSSSSWSSSISSSSSSSSASNESSSALSTASSSAAADVSTGPPLAVPTGSVAPSPASPENINSMYQVVIGFGGVIVAGYQAD